MRSRRWLHAAVWLAGLVGLPAPARAAPVAAVAKPAGSASNPVAEAAEVPAWSPSPARFAVAPFENRANVRPFDWLIDGAPFEIAEKTEAALWLEPTGGPLYVGAAGVLADPKAVAAFAAARGAEYVITGWVERPNWLLRIDLTLWRAEGGTARALAEAQRTGDLRIYHQMLGDALGEIWSKGAEMTIDPARTQQLQRPLATDIYAVTLMGRGLGHLITGLAANQAIAAAAAAAGSGTGRPPVPAAPTPAQLAAASELKAAEHDLERAVFIDPKCFEAQRLLGELYLATAGGDPRAIGRAIGKFNYANDLAPDDIAALRAAASGAAQTGKHQLALELFRRLVSRRPWDIEARFQLGSAMWRTGDAAGAARQLEQVTAHQPDHVAARRVLVLIHAARSDTRALAGELEAIAARTPGDVEVKADLATAYGALGQWDKATAQLEAIAPARPADVALQVRIGDAHRRRGDLDGALTWYGKASRLAPEWSWPGFAAVQALFDAGKLTEAGRAYTALLRFREEMPAAEQAIGSILLIQNQPDAAAWNLRMSVKESPRELVAWQALIAAELGRRDPALATRDLAAALPTWPDDPALHYLAGVTHAMLDEKQAARQELGEAAARAPAGSPINSAATTALGALDAGGGVTLQFTPALVRPWGDADALGEALARYARTSAAIAAARLAYQRALLGVLGALGRGPDAPARRGPPRGCPVGRVAPGWAAARAQLAAIERLGVDLEASWRYIARHDEAGATASLLPNARAEVAAARKAWRLALEDIAELRAEWARATGPELAALGCTDRLLAAAVADPAHYRLPDDEPAETIPVPQPPRPRARATFYVNNTQCPDPVSVWIDGAEVGQVPPGRRSALVADGGERTLCLLVPGAAQCGDRGTVREVYLHDGWSVTMHCPK